VSVEWHAIDVYRLLQHITRSTRNICHNRTRFLRQCIE
jgi:hypothetical protein